MLSHTQPTLINPGHRQRSRRVLGLICAWIWVSTAAILAPANADTGWALSKPLQAYSARYTVGNDVVDAGQADIELARTENPNEWNYSLVTRPIGLFKLAGKGHVQESSIFTLIDQDGSSVILPQRYRFRQDKQSKRAVDATFNWEQSKLYYQRGNDQSTSELTVSTLDRMTMTVAMMSTLTPDFETFTLSVFDGGRLKEVELVNEGTETLKTALGQVDTVKVRTRNVAGSSRETMTWFAPSLNNLPVRIEQLKRGELVARLSVSRYTPEQ